MTPVRRVPSLVLVVQLAMLAALSACADGADLQQPAAERPVGDTPIGGTPGDTTPGDSLPADSLPGDTLPVDTLPGDTLPTDPPPPDVPPPDVPPPDGPPGDTTEVDPTGSIAVRTTSGGASFDGDGYAATVAGAASRALGLEGETTFDDVGTGVQAVQLDGVAANCTVIDGASRSVTVGAGAEVTVEFRVDCTASGIPGKLSLTVHTDGANLDPDGYRVTITGGPTLDIATGVIRIVPDVASGLQRVTLGGIASNCAVTNGPATREVTIPEGTEGAGAVEFRLGCR